MSINYFLFPPFISFFTVFHIYFLYWLIIDVVILVCIINLKLPDLFLVQKINTVYLFVSFFENAKYYNETSKQIFITKIKNKTRMTSIDNCKKERENNETKIYGLTNGQTTFVA